MEETYYKKILVSSGEVPEENGMYDTNIGRLEFIGKDWYYERPIPQQIDPSELMSYWLKPVPSPKQEAVEFAEWVREKDFARNGRVKEGLFWYDPINGTYHTTSELYDKFKEKGESK